MAMRPLIDQLFLGSRLGLLKIPMFLMSGLYFVIVNWIELNQPRSGDVVFYSFLAVIAGYGIIELTILCIKKPLLNPLVRFGGSILVMGVATYVYLAADLLPESRDAAVEIHSSGRYVLAVIGGWIYTIYVARD